MNDGGAPPGGFREDYSAPSGTRLYGHESPLVEQAVDFIINQPFPLTRCDEGANSRDFSSAVASPLPTVAPGPAGSDVAWSTMEGVDPSGQAYPGYEPDVTLHGYEDNDLDDPLSKDSFNVFEVTSFTSFSAFPPLPPEPTHVPLTDELQLPIPAVTTGLGVDTGWRGSLPPSAADMYYREPTYLVRGLDAPFLRSLVSPTPGETVVLDYVLQPGTILPEYRMWHHNALEVGPPVSEFEPYGGQALAVPHAGLWEFQLRASRVDRTLTGLSNSRTLFLRSADVTGRPLAELLVETRDPAAYRPPPTPTLIPFQPPVVRQVRPGIIALQQEYPVPGSFRIRVEVTPSPLGVLEYRFWRHSGAVASGRWSRWHVAPARTFYIDSGLGDDQIENPVYFGSCFEHGVFNAACPMPVPVHWDFQVRVRPDGAGTGDASLVERLLVWGVPPP